MKIPFLVLLFLHSYLYQLFLPAIKPYYITHTLHGFLELLKYISVPDNYKFPNYYSVLIKTIILSNCFCLPTFTEKWLQYNEHISDIKNFDKLYWVHIGYTMLESILCCENLSAWSTWTDFQINMLQCEFLSEVCYWECMSLMSELYYNSIISQ